MLKKIAERILRSVDCGMVAFTNELYQFRVLGTLAEPELSNEELVAVRQLIEDRFPLGSNQWSRELLDKWTSAADRRDASAPGVGPLTSGELTTAAGLIRYWAQGKQPNPRKTNEFLALADRLESAALNLIPVST